MTREDARELGPIITAFGEGKTVEWFDTECEMWREVGSDPIFRLSVKYRIRNSRLKHDDISDKSNNTSYRPFEDSAELILTFNQTRGIEFSVPTLYEPIIWVKSKKYDTRFLITGFSEDCICIEREWAPMSTLFEKFVFLDGSPCGLKY